MIFTSWKPSFSPTRKELVYATPESRLVKQLLNGFKVNVIYHDFENPLTIATIV